MTDLFSRTHRPDTGLAARLRPTRIEDVIGQEHIIGAKGPLRRILEKKIRASVIMYGPPGCGKTTLGLIIARNLDLEPEFLNAVTARIDDIRDVRRRSEERRSLYNRGTVLFIDEIHRFNKAQQDALLEDIENNVYSLIGATTLNPAFYIVPPLLSRCLVFKLEPPGIEEIERLLRRVSENENIFPEAQDREGLIRYITEFSGGDIRVALNILELATNCGVVTIDELRQVSPDRIMRYDRDGDSHYDIVSAFIKSLRGSDPDAALYWLARMIEAGEDIAFLLRRMIIFASEDIGNADPQALQVSVAAASAFERVGMPEGRIILYHAATYLASAPKSNASYRAGEKARQRALRDQQPVPPHLRSADFFSGEKKKYLYPHDFDEGIVRQEYWQNPERFYEPSPYGAEKVIRERLREWAEKKRTDR